MVSVGRRPLLPAYRILCPHSQTWSGKCSKPQGSGWLLAFGRCQQEQSVRTPRPYPGTRWWRAGLCSQDSQKDTYSGCWKGKSCEKVAKPFQMLVVPTSSLKMLQRRPPHFYHLNAVTVDSLCSWLSLKNSPACRRALSFLENGLFWPIR